MICEVMYGAHRRAEVKGLAADLWPHAATAATPCKGAEEANGPQCDSYHHLNTQAGNAKEH